jgi:serine/threonine-protein kinase HipA
MGLPIGTPFTIKLAMALPGKNRHYRTHDIRCRHFNSTARIVNYGADVEPLIEEILGGMP